MHLQILHWIVSAISSVFSRVTAAGPCGFDPGEAMGCSAGVLSSNCKCIPVDTVPAAPCIAPATVPATPVYTHPMSTHKHVSETLNCSQQGAYTSHIT